MGIEFGGYDLRDSSHFVLATSFVLGIELGGRKVTLLVCQL
jgi:hypothetical protein